MSNEDNICHTCGRPKPRAKYRMDDGDVWAGAFLGVMAAFVALGFGVNGWLATATGMAGLVLGAGAVAGASRRRWNRDRDDA